MTAAELREALTAAGVDVPADARKADLVALHDAHLAGTGGAVSTPPVPASPPKIGALYRLRRQD